MDEKKMLDEYILVVSIFFNVHPEWKVINLWNNYIYC